MCPWPPLPERLVAVVAPEPIDAASVDSADPPVETCLMSWQSYCSRRLSSSDRKVHVELNRMRCRFQTQSWAERRSITAERSTPAEKCFPSPCKIMARVCSGGSVKKDSMPAIVASSRALLLAGRDRRNSVTGPRWLAVRLFGDPVLPRSRSFPGAHRFVIGSCSFARYALGAPSYANYRFGPSDETYRNSPLALV
jgi:hypothetical protein